MSLRFKSIFEDNSIVDSILNSIIIVLLVCSTDKVNKLAEVQNGEKNAQTTLPNEKENREKNNNSGEFKRLKFISPILPVFDYVQNVYVR